MSQTAAYEHTPLADSFQSDEPSQVRRRRAPAPIIVDDPAHEPVPVHVTVRLRQGVRRYYVGVRFDAGVIPSQEWERAMLRDGIGAGAISATRRWLNRHSL